jgi:hypothetical protein
MRRGNGAGTNRRPPGDTRRTSSSWGQAGLGLDRSLHDKWPWLSTVGTATSEVILGELAELRQSRHGCILAPRIGRTIRKPSGLFLLEDWQ